MPVDVVWEHALGIGADHAGWHTAMAHPTEGAASHGPLLVAAHSGLHAAPPGSAAPTAFGMYVNDNPFSPGGLIGKPIEDPASQFVPNYYTDDELGFPFKLNHAQETVNDYHFYEKTHEFAMDQMMLGKGLFAPKKWTMCAPPLVKFVSRYYDFPDVSRVLHPELVFDLNGLGQDELDKLDRVAVFLRDRTDDKVMWDQVYNLIPGPGEGLWRTAPFPSMLKGFPFMYPFTGTKPFHQMCVPPGTNDPEHIYELDVYGLTPGRHPQLYDAEGKFHPHMVFGVSYRDISGVQETCDEFECKSR